MGELRALCLVVVLGLVTYTVTRFWLKDTLPAKFRITLQNRVLGAKPNWAREKLHELLGCPHCVSGHVSWIAVVVTVIFSSVPLPVAVWLGAWGLHRVIYRHVEMPVEVNLPVLRHREAKFE